MNHLVYKDTSHAKCYVTGYNYQNFNIFDIYMISYDKHQDQKVKNYLEHHIYIQEWLLYH